MKMNERFQVMLQVDNLMNERRLVIGFDSDTNEECWGALMLGKPQHSVIQLPFIHVQV